MPSTAQRPHLSRALSSPSTLYTASVSASLFLWGAVFIIQRELPFSIFSPNACYFFGSIVLFPFRIPSLSSKMPFIFPVYCLQHVTVVSIVRTLISAPLLLQSLRFLLMVNGLWGRGHHTTQPGSPQSMSTPRVPHNITQVCDRVNGFSLALQVFLSGFTLIKLVFPLWISQKLLSSFT